MQETKEQHMGQPTQLVKDGMIQASAQISTDVQTKKYEQGVSIDQGRVIQASA